MRTIFLTLLLIFCSLYLNAQNYYKAVLTEMYSYNKTTKTWDLYQKNSDVNIVIVVEDGFINIQAKSPSFFKIYLDTKENLNIKNFVGSSYVAKDFKNDKLIKIDILSYTNSDYIVLSLIDSDDGYNFRYFLTEMK